MRNLYRKFYLFLLSAALLSACGGLNVEKVPLGQAETPPADAQPSPIGFNKIYYAIPTGTPVKSYSAKGMLGVISCSAPFGVAESGISSRSFPNDSLREIFFDTLESEGYDVAGNPGRMFDEREDLMRANYKVGARVTDIKMDLCRQKSLLGIERGDTGEARIKVEWTVFDSLHHKNAYTKTTEGYASLEIANHEATGLLLEKAFEAAAHNLGADEEFHKLIFFGTPPENIPATVPDPNEEPLSLYSPDESVTLQQTRPSVRPVKPHLPEALKGVVMIETGTGHSSGFFVGGQGHIVTSAYAVGDALRVRVVTSGKEEKLTAEILRKDYARDVALLRLEKIPDDLHLDPLPVRTEKPKVGDTVYAIGAPREKRLQDTVTKGIVSALRFDRRENQPYIQADIDVYPGNGGGPLLDENGNVIGIAASGYTAAPETLDGLSWFIPISDALEKLGIGLEGQGGN